MKKSLLLILCLCSFCYSFADKRSLTEMKALAANVIKAPAKPGMSYSSGSNSLRVIKQYEAFTIIGNDYAFAIIAHDDDYATGILGYCNSPYDEETMNPSMRWWINMANEALTSDSEAAFNAEEALNTAKSTVSVDVVEPILETTWNQGEPYYNMTPTKTSSGVSKHCLTGCVATAMAQVMNYYKHPTQGTGSNSYTLPDGTNVSASFNSTYDWDNMLPTYKTGKYNTTQANAVAKLMFHCGVAVKMEYDLDGSGAYASDIPVVLNKYFSYTPNARYYCSDYVCSRDMVAIAREMLAAKQPVIFGGQSAKEGGHVFILDGIDENGLFHVNWGWGGHEDGYFAMTALNGFNNSQELIVTVPSTKTFAFKSDIVAFSPITATVSSDSRSASITAQFMNQCIQPFNGNINAIIKNDTYKYTAKTVSYSSNKINYFYYAKSSFNVPIPSGIPDGTYTLCFTSKTSNDASEQDVRSGDNVCNSFTLVVKSGKISSLSSNPNTYSGIKSIRPAGNAANAKTTRVFDSEGRLIYVSAADKFSVDDVPANGLLIIRNGSTATKVMKTK